MLQRMRLIDGVKEATLTSSVSVQQLRQRRSTSCPSPNPTFSVNVTFEPLPASHVRASDHQRLQPGHARGRPGRAAPEARNDRS